MLDHDATLDSVGFVRTSDTVDMIGAKRCRGIMTVLTPKVTCNWAVIDPIVPGDANRRVPQSVDTLATVVGVTKHETRPLPTRLTRVWDRGEMLMA